MGSGILLEERSAAGEFHKVEGSRLGCGNEAEEEDRGF